MQRDGLKKIETEWLGLRQLTQYADISERTVRGWIRSQIDPLPAVQVRGKILVRRSDFDLWLTKHPVQTLMGLDLNEMVRKVLHGRAGAQTKRL